MIRAKLRPTQLKVTSGKCSGILLLRYEFIWGRRLILHAFGKVIEAHRFHATHSAMVTRRRLDQ